MNENKKPLILIVDDEPAMLDIYARELSDADLDVVIASSGREGIDTAIERQPNLILMDVKMPEMDGVESALKLKGDPRTENIKIVFLSAFGDPMAVQIDKKFAREIGAMDFLQKGLGLREFAEKVKEYLKSE